MGNLSDSFTNLAIELTQLFGRASAVTFSRQVVGDYDTNTLTRVDAAPITYTCNAAPVNFKLKEIDQVTVVSGQKMLYIPGVDTSDSSVSPQVGDTVQLEVIYRVLEVIPYETESVNCAYLLKIGI